MTLLIACLIIYGLKLEAWLYAVAVVVWIAHRYANDHSDIVERIAKGRYAS